MRDEMRSVTQADDNHEKRPDSVRVHVRPHLPKRNPLVRLALCPASLVENLRQRKRRGGRPKWSGGGREEGRQEAAARKKEREGAEAAAARWEPVTEWLNA